MKKRFFTKFKKFVCLLVIASFSTWLPGGAAWAAGNPVPLSQVPIPMPPNLGEFLKADVNGNPTPAARLAALRLGKALFWDMNVGGDGVQACASCHYRAGADPINSGPNPAPGFPIPDPSYPSAVNLRATNQLNPGANGLLDVLAGPNLPLTAAMFPFTQVTNPLTARLKDGVTFTTNLDDVVGSQGVSDHLFTAIGNPVDAGTPINDPIFGNSRRVTGRNTPPAVNAVFNYANFWDGRANNIFNGSSPIGPIDAGAGIWVNLAGAQETPILSFQKVAIPNASLASQAVGPPNNAVEMSYDGRTFPQLGRKLLNNGLTPLGQQKVSPNDSLLGPLSNDPGLGLKNTVSYAKLIQEAFQDKYWNSVNVPNSTFTQMEANFSLFWGLSVMLYEATLVSDQSPFDNYLAGNATAMTAQQIKGFGIFQSKCGMCHAGSELSDATVSNALANGLIEKGATSTGAAISDIGYINLGLRPTVEDIGRGGIGGAFNPFASFAQEAIAQANGTLPFLAPQAIFGGITANTPLAVNGSFKTPVLRNVALTAPYFHNGSVLTLAELVDFYARGGNFANAEQAKDMNAPVGLNAADRADLVEFLQNALTDPRVDAETAPFDHPQLFIPSGNVPVPPAAEILIERPATGGPAFDFDAFFAPNRLETLTLADLPKATVEGVPAGPINGSGKTLAVTVSNGDQYVYSLDSGTTYSAPISTATPIPLSNLTDGTKTITVRGVNSGTGHQQSAAAATTVTLTVDITSPTVEVAPPETMTKKSAQTISGTVEAGGKVSVSVDTGAMVGPVTVSGTTWSCQVSGLNKGSNKITVVATDAAGNTTTTTATTKILISDGCFRGTGNPDVSDALKALKMAVGIISPTEDDLLHGDVNADSKIDSGDSLLILRKVVGLSSF